MSKLNSEQKSILKDMKAHFKMLPNATLQSFINMGLTIAVCRKFEGAKMLCVAVSRISDDEPKFRRKVGEWEVLKNIANGEYLQFPVPSGTEQEFIFQFVDWQNGMFDLAFV